MHIFLIVLSLSFAALFSGLTIGLMGLDISTLKRKAKQGDKDAEKVIHIRERGTQLMVTLLLGNAASNAYLSILLGDKYSGLIAGLVSTVLIFLFGEVIPMAFLTRHAVPFGAKSAPLIRIILFIFAPVTKPIAWLIDTFLGEEISKVYTKKDILDIISDDESVAEGDVDTDEKRIVRGSLSFSHKFVRDILTPSTVAYTVHIDDIIDEKLLTHLKDVGHSRLPVRSSDERQFVGMLYLKDLIGIQLPMPVREVMDSTVHFVSDGEPLDNVLDQFIKTKIHLFIVLDEFAGFQGVVTLEDVLEEIIGTEIMDEDDEDADLREVARAKTKIIKKK